MDKQDATIREYLAEKANLVAAIRLPNTAFKNNAGTEVTTDILFLKKRITGQEPEGASWTETDTVAIEDRPVGINEYFIPLPRLMLGENTLKITITRCNE